MNGAGRIKFLFIIAALYDGILGLGFLLLPQRIFTTFGVIPPNHPGYLEFPATLLLVFSLMFLALARDPFSNRNLIPYSVLFKLGYAGVVFWHWFLDDIPSMWKPFAVCDIVFAALFTAAYFQLSKKK